MKRFLIAGLALASASCLAFGAMAQDAPAPSVPPAAPEPTVSPAPAAPAVPVAPNAATATVAPADGVMVAAVPPSGATVEEAMIPNPQTPIEKQISQQLSFQAPSVNVNRMASLLFTAWEHDLVIDARRGLVTRTPGTEDGITEAGPRDVSLAGIVYHSSKEWTIWLNDMRVSPSAIPDEVLDLRVYKDYIELEWFDASTNQIFPIRLRAHQRFNLDTRMFLPG